MSTTENKALVRRLFAAIDSGDLAVFDDIFAPEIPLDGNRVFGNQAGPEGMKHHSGAVKNAIPDLKHTVHDMIAEGDIVAVRWTLTGTHKGAFRGIAPTGKWVSASFMEMFRFKDGKIVERWTEGDRLGMLQQIGAIPMPQRTS